MKNDDSQLGTRYSRQALFGPIGEAGQKQLMQGRALLVGCGGLGTIIADIMTRAGIGLLRIVDRDFVEESNLQRQVLFDTDDVEKNLPKAEAARRRLARVNPGVEIEALVRDVDASSITSMVDDVDVILDGTDNFETRYLINDTAVSTGTPWVYGAVVGSYGMAAAILPGTTPCLRCIFKKSPPPGASPTCDTAGILAPAVHTIASIQAAEAMKILCGLTDEIEPAIQYADVWHGQYSRVSLAHAKDPACETCGKKNFVYLNAERESYVTTLCGRNAVQISWKEEHAIDFETLAGRLEKAGDVTHNRFLLKFEHPDATITLFPDGRAIIEGTDDTERARELYSKFIG
ncbi:ThiF family adenylyltransferase [Planctomycetota bacterium]